MKRLLSLALLTSASCTSTGGDGDSFAYTSPTLSTGPTSSSTSETSETSETSDSGETGEAKLDLAADDTPSDLPEVAEVFGHSADTLYRLDPDTLEVTEVGPLTGCDSSVLDIALDADSNMYGIGSAALWAIDRETGACTPLTPDGDFITSLSFVPEAGGGERLVAFDEAQYISIDPQTGAITNSGVSLPDALVSSGDIVSVIGGGTYLTVKGPGCEATDCIVEIDPETGAVEHNYGSVGYNDVFGLAFWGGKAYGFALEGIVFEIEFVGDAVVSTPIPVPAAPPGLQWYGAGSTTSAPPIEG